LDVTEWLLWFFACLQRAISGADEMLAAIILKARLCNLLRRCPGKRTPDHSSQPTAGFDKQQHFDGKSDGDFPPENRLSSADRLDEMLVHNRVGVTSNNRRH